MDIILIATRFFMIQLSSFSRISLLFLMYLLACARYLDRSHLRPACFVFYFICGTRLHFCAYIVFHFICETQICLRHAFSYLSFLRCIYTVCIFCLDVLSCRCTVCVDVSDTLHTSVVIYFHDRQCFDAYAGAWTSGFLVLLALLLLWISICLVSFSYPFYLFHIFSFLIP